MGIDNQTLMLDETMGEAARGEVTFQSGAVVYIRYVPEGQITKVLETSNDRRTGRTDFNAYNSKCGRMIITGWDKVTIGQLIDWNLPVIKKPEVDADGFVPYSNQMAGQIMAASSEFRLRISDCHNDLEAEQKKLRKNALGLS